MLNKKFLLVITVLFVGQTFDVCCMETDTQLVANNSGDALSITDLRVLDFTLIRNQMPYIINDVLGDLAILNIESKNEIKNRNDANAFLEQNKDAINKDAMKNASIVFLKYMSRAARLRAVSKDWQNLVDPIVNKQLSEVDQKIKTIFTAIGKVSSFPIKELFAKTVYKMSFAMLDNIRPLEVELFLAKKFFLKDKDACNLYANNSKYNVAEFVSAFIAKNYDCPISGSVAAALIKMPSDFKLRSGHFEDAIMNNCVPVAELFIEYTNNLRINQNSRELQAYEFDCIEAINSQIKTHHLDEEEYSSPLFYAIYKGWGPMIKALLQDSEINVNAQPLLWGLRFLNTSNYNNMMPALKLIIQHKNFKLTDQLEQQLQEMSQNNQATFAARTAGVKEIINFLKTLPQNNGEAVQSITVHEKEKQVEEREAQPSGMRSWIRSLLPSWSSSGGTFDLGRISGEE